jgi:hypothetical protein
MKKGVASYLGVVEDLRRITSFKLIKRCTKKQRRRHINPHKYMWERGGGGGAA